MESYHPVSYGNLFPFSLTRNFVPIISNKSHFFYNISRVAVHEHDMNIFMLGLLQVSDYSIYHASVSTISLIFYAF